MPRFRDAEFHSAKNCVNFQLYFVLEHDGVTQVEFDSAEDGLNEAAAKVRASDSALNAAEDGYFVQRCRWVDDIRVMQSVANPLGDFVFLERSPHDDEAREDDGERPQLSPSEMPYA